MTTKLTSMYTISHLHISYSGSYLAGPGYLCCLYAASQEIQDPCLLVWTHQHLFQDVDQSYGHHMDAQTVSLF